MRGEGRLTYTENMERQNEESGLSVDEAPRVVKRGRTMEAERWIWPSRRGRRERADGSFMQGTIVNQSRGSVSRVCGPGVTTGRAGVIEGEERRERRNRDDKYCFCHDPWDVRGAASSLSELESRGRG